MEVFNFKNRLIVEVKDKQLPNNKRLKMFKINFLPHTVCVLPVFTRSKEIVLLRQYRPAIDKYIIEAPAGTAEPNEKPEETAKRELEEETGLISTKLVNIANGYVSPGYTTEYMHYYLSIDPLIGKPSPEATEIIEPIRVNIKQAIDFINKGIIEDSKTVLVVLFANIYLASQS
ncbi:MAG: NUDIX hydrolase [Caldisphaeraceae archaeon]|nr:NUDIX hydrolase [Caldisphaeraceae archaeon]